MPRLNLPTVPNALDDPWQRWAADLTEKLTRAVPGLHLSAPPRTAGPVQKFCEDLVRALFRYDESVLRRDGVSDHGLLTRDGLGNEFRLVECPAVRAVAAGLSGASVTIPALIVAGSWPVGVFVEVTEAITGATSFQVGVAAFPDAWGAAIPIALNTKSVQAQFAPRNMGLFNVSEDVILTANGGAFTGGTVVLVYRYLLGA